MTAVIVAPVGFTSAFSVRIACRGVHPVRFDTVPALSSASRKSHATNGLYGLLSAQSDPFDRGAFCELVQPGLAKESQALRSISAIPDNNVTDVVGALFMRKA